MIRNQSGNVIFYVLIAVALLAAMSYVVAQSGRGGVGSLSSDKAALYADEIISYGNVVSQSTDQIRLRGYLVEWLSFENSVVAGYENPTCSDDECKIFHISGGGVNYIAPKSAWLDFDQSAQPHYGEYYIYGGASSGGFATARDDLILFLPYIKKDICIAINDKLGTTPSARDVPLETNGPFESGDKFIGTFGSSLDYKVYGDGTVGQTDILFGKSGGCTESSGGGALPPAGTYHYYQVLQAR
jgi:hypothetical protein